MRSEPDAGSLILAAEDFLLMHSCDWEEREEELERAKDRLRWLLKKPDNKS